MTILLGYATYSSGTRAASSLVASVLGSHGHTVDHKDIREVSEADIKKADAVVLASPSWFVDGKEGQPHEFYKDFMARLAGKTFPEKPFAIFGLGDTAFMNFCGAVDHLERFVEQLRGKRVINSQRIDGFYFNQMQNEKILTDWATELAKHLS